MIGTEIGSGVGTDRSGRAQIRPPRLNFAGVCLWCGLRDCKSSPCVEAHARSSWMVCDHCHGFGLGDCDCGCLLGVVEAAARRPERERVRVGDVTVRVFDRGPEPEYHKDRGLYGPWLPYEAELLDQPGLIDVGWTPAEAIARVLAQHAAAWASSWPAPGASVVASESSTGTVG